MDLFLQLLVGLAGGTVAGLLLRQRGPKLVVSAFAGLLGGGLGGSILYSMSPGAAATTLMAGSAAAAIGGTLLALLVTLFMRSVRGR